MQGVNARRFIVMVTRNCEMISLKIYETSLHYILGSREIYKLLIKY
jgi:hypothetical protein